MIAQFRARLDLDNRSVAIVDRDSDPLYTYGSDLSCSNVTETLLRAGWNAADRSSWRHTSSPDGFEFDVTRARERWTGFAGWCPNGHQVRETTLDTDAPDKATISQYCPDCGRSATLDRLPLGEPVDGPITEYGVFDLSSTDRGESGELTGPLCVERRYVDRSVAFARVGLYNSGVVAVVCPVHDDMLAGWCPFCPPDEVAGRSHVIMRRPVTPSAFTVQSTGNES